MTSTQTYCAMLALTGRPNVGKSTLLNHLLGQKISITSRKKQTTRYAVKGIKTEHNRQIIFVDTPGLHLQHFSQLNTYMNQAAHDALLEVDLILMVIEAGKITPEDEWILELISQQKQTQKLLLINKVDQLKDKKQLLPQIERLKQKAQQLGMDFLEIIPLSAFINQDIQLLEQHIIQYVPESPFLFPADMLTDLSEDQLVSEIIREQLIRFTGKELPYQTHVVVEQSKIETKKRKEKAEPADIHQSGNRSAASQKILPDTHSETHPAFPDSTQIKHIHATIYVERVGQKPIILGKEGARLKQIATLARHNIEKLIGCQIMLRLWIKVKPEWTQDKVKMRQLGYFAKQ